MTPTNNFFLTAVGSLSHTVHRKSSDHLCASAVGVALSSWTIGWTGEDFNTFSFSENSFITQDSSDRSVEDWLRWPPLLDVMSCILHVRRPAWNLLPVFVTPDSHQLHLPDRTRQDSVVLVFEERRLARYSISKQLLKIKVSMPLKNDLQ